MPEIAADLETLLTRVAEGGARSCGADDALVSVRDGDVLRVVAHYGPIPTELHTFSLTDGSEHARYYLELRRFHTTDLLANMASLTPEIVERVRAAGIRTVLALPLGVEGRLVGSLLFRRREARAFTDGEIAHLETYAEMAAVGANDRYVLGRPKIDEVEVLFRPDPNALAANILAGTVELTSGASPWPKCPSLPTSHETAGTLSGVPAIPRATASTSVWKGGQPNPIRDSRP